MLFGLIRCHFFRGRRQPLNPGAGPAPVSSPEAFGGNRRLYTLAAPAADHLVLTSCRFRFAGPGTVPCNLQYILRVVFKNHRFLQGFVAFAVSRFHLGDVKKPWFFIHLGLWEGSGTETWTSWRPWYQHRANLDQDVGYMGQLKAKIGESLRQHRPRCGLHGPT